MKRIYIAIALLIITSAVCTYEYIFVSKSTEEYIVKVDRIEREYTKDNRSGAIKLSEELYNQWSHTVASMDKLLYHDYVDDISNNMSKLNIYISNRDTTEFYATCRELKNQLQSLKDSEIPKPENIV